MKTTKNNKVTVISKAPKSVATADWYNSLKDEVEAVRVETVFIAQETLLKGKLQIGELICQNVQATIPVTALVQYLSHDVKISERDLWYCAKFYQQYEKIKKLPEYQSKAISWNKVKLLISAPDKKKECEHEHTVKICICEDCGKKIEANKSK